MITITLSAQKSEVIPMLGYSPLGVHPYLHVVKGQRKPKRNPELDLIGLLLVMISVLQICKQSSHCGTKDTNTQWESNKCPVT